MTTVGAGVIALVAALYVLWVACIWWCREHGGDGHRHAWGSGGLVGGRVGYRVCSACGEYQYEVTG